MTIDQLVMGAWTLVNSCCLWKEEMNLSMTSSLTINRLLVYGLWSPLCSVFLGSFPIQSTMSS